MRKTLLVAGVLALGMLLSACQSDLRYGEQVNSENTHEASMTNDKVIQDVVKGANSILSLLTNANGNTFDQSHLETLLDQEMVTTQNAMMTLEKHRQPDSLSDKTKNTIEALSNYKSALLFLREKVKSGQPFDQERQQFISALNNLQSASYSAP